MRGPDSIRFHEYYVPEPNTGCYLWLGAINSDGHGNFTRMSPRKHSVAAHRMAWELANGPIPPGLVIDHLCRVRPCVNPSHLRAVTSRENTLCGIGPAAMCAKRTHCPHGHPYDINNTYRHKANGRVARRCRTCLAARRKR